jgi:hypothetical protein
MWRLLYGGPSRRFPQSWSVEPMPSGYRVLDANGITLAHAYGQPEVQLPSSAAA